MFSLPLCCDPLIRSGRQGELCVCSRGVTQSDDDIINGKLMLHLSQHHLISLLYFFSPSPHYLWLSFLSYFVISCQHTSSLIHPSSLFFSYLTACGLILHMGELIAALCYCAATSLTHLHTVRCGVLIGNGRRWGWGGEVEGWGEVW